MLFRSGVNFLAQIFKKKCHAESFKICVSVNAEYAIHFVVNKTRTMDQIGT
jgi:hypothetical protein